jgi:UDP:flavonoid glycosyltransferase YjiC (YdhE family)
MGHLKKCGFPVIGHIRGLPETERKAMGSPTICLSASLMNLDRLADQCDIAVTQGGLHTSARMLLSGARLLICPEQLEQTLLAYRLQQRGLCEFMSFFSDAHTVSEKFEITASSSKLATSAAAFAASHTGYQSANTVEKIVDTCLEAL